MPGPRAFDRLPSLAVAIGLVAVATTLRLAADPRLGLSVPYLLLFPAVVIAAIPGGVGPGVAATCLSAFPSKPGPEKRLPLMWKRPDRCG